MRVTKSDVISGMPAPEARALMRRMLNQQVRTRALAAWLNIDESAAVERADALVADGFLVHMNDGSDGGEVEWTTTIKGNALAQASFGKPMNRSKAEDLLKQVLERASAYNSDPTRLLSITEIRIFGSYLKPEVQELGDLDLAIRYARRNGETYLNDMQRQAYEESSPASLSAEIMYPLTDLIRRLKQRSRFVKVTSEDIERFTQSWKIVYEMTSDPGAIRLDDRHVLIDQR